MITLDNVHKSFGPKHVLRGVDLTCPQRRKHGDHRRLWHREIDHHQKPFSGLVTPDQGKVIVDGEDVTHAGIGADRDAFLARFGMLFQGGALFDSLTVWQNVAFRLLRGALKRPKAEAREIAIEKLRRVGSDPRCG